MAQMGEITVTLRLVDRLTPALHRARYHFLTPIGRRLPPRGSLAWQMLELQVALRRAGRALWAALPGGRAVPYDKAALNLYRWAVVIGAAWWTVGVVLVLLHVIGLLR